MSEPQEAAVSVHGNLTTKRIVMMERLEFTHHFNCHRYGCAATAWHERMRRRAVERLREVAVCARLCEVWP